MSSEFDTEVFEKKLTTLKDTQDGIQQLSSWCLQRRNHHKKIVSCWLNVLKQVRVEHRLVLFYLANDVIQNSKRKHYEFVDSWATALQKATTMVRDEKVRDKILRIFKIWQQREVYSEEYLGDLSGLLNINTLKKNNTSHKKAQPSNDFQNSTVIGLIKDCVQLGSETDKNFKQLPRSNNFLNIETVKSNIIKDRSHTEDIEKEIDHYVTSLDSYIKSLKIEIKSRQKLVQNIEEAKRFYGHQREEVKVVVNAYKNFGIRTKTVKKKLDEILPNLPSPIPSPDINAPSPEPEDADIALPDDECSFNTNLLSASANNYVSYMDGNLPFDINDFKSESTKPIYDEAQAIQVIGTRPEEKRHLDFAVNSYNTPISKLYTNDFNTSNAFDSPGYNTSIISQNIISKPSLLPPPPIPPTLNDHSLDFAVEWNSPWNTNNSFSNIIDTPVSPPHFEKEGINLRLVEYDDDLDDLGIFSEDIDNRKLPLLSKEKDRLVDVDHRNLISLTGSPGLNSKADDFVNSFLTDTDDLFQEKDIDYRTQGFDNCSIESSDINIIPLKPPSSLIEIEQTFAETELPATLLSPKSKPTPTITTTLTTNISKIEPIGTIRSDNIESVDMDVSDDDLENYINDENDDQQATENNQNYTLNSPVVGDNNVSAIQTTDNSRTEETTVIESINVWDNWKVNNNNKFNAVRMNPPHMYNQPRYRGAGRNYPNKFNPQMINKGPRGAPFYFNRGQRGGPPRGPMIGFHRGNFRGRPWN